MFGQASCDARGRLTIHTAHRHNTPLERLVERAGLEGDDPAVRNGLAHAGQAVHTPFERGAVADPRFEHQLHAVYGKPGGRSKGGLPAALAH